MFGNALKWGCLIFVISGCSAQERDSLGRVMMTNLGAVMLVPGYTAVFDDENQNANISKLSNILISGQGNEKPLILLQTTPNTKSEAIRFLQQIGAIPVESGAHQYVLQIRSQSKDECFIGYEYGWMRSDASYVYVNTTLSQSRNRGGSVIFQHEIAACGRRSADFIEENLARHSLRNLGS